MSETINIPRDTTMQLLVKVHRDQIAGEMDLKYKEKVAAATSKAEVDALFTEWWKIQYNPELFTKAEMLERWFGNVLVDTRVHGVTTPRYAKSTSMIGELTDDSAGLTCTPSTESTAGNDPFAHLPQFWCLEVAAEKKADGSHEIFYVEHIDDTAKVRGGEYLCWVLQKNTYKREWQDKDYKYLKTRCTPAPGYKRWKEGTDRTGKVHEYMAHPKYYAGLDADGHVLETGETLEDGIRVVQQLLAEGIRPDGILCGEDLTAAGVLKALLRAGIRVPEETAVVGYDNSTYARLCEPELTSVDNKPEQVALLCVQLLQSRIEHGEDYSSVTLQPELVQRQSS